MLGVQGLVTNDIPEIIGMGINKEQTIWSPDHTTQQLGIYPINLGPTLPHHDSTIFRLSMLHSLHPENNLAMSLPSGKEEAEFLWHTWAKATLQMFTRGRVPSLSCYMSE